ncbi:hypothetical protein [Clostridium tarantellae]|uniref:SMI1/KNR4 family protein n=1 Tax=Clostridium tarantellae TaxID=39493 RepID=A0A6I1MN50_9CLOT|nr:hypothetical protein [Clostridium tarantellae]MPQ44825.1 hypothetical protein [Clostridium tarantellae]
MTYHSDLSEFKEWIKYVDPAITYSNYSEFKTQWIKYMNPSITYSEDIVNNLNISNDDKDFLINVGFPKNCSPFLIFQSLSEGAFLPLTKKFNLKDEYYNDFFYIGFNNELDIITIENTSSQIKCIDFQSFEELYVNNSILTFAESLLQYFIFIRKVNGPCAYLRENCPPTEIQLLKNSLNNIDNSSLLKDTFWGEEITKFYI